MPRPDKLLLTLALALPLSQLAAPAAQAAVESPDRFEVTCNGGPYREWVPICWPQWYTTLGGAYSAWESISGSYWPPGTTWDSGISQSYIGETKC